MNRDAGFSLIEVMVATVVLLIAVTATLKALTDAVNANQGVALMADTQENLRAAMNYMVRDIVQAGEGIPTGGITIPNNGFTAASASVAPPGGNSNLNRPGLSPTALPVIQFPTTYTTIPAITPGSQEGEVEETPNPSGGTITGPNTDIITIIYADTTLQDTTTYPGTIHTLSEFPIYLAPSASGAGCNPVNPNPAPAGSISLAGSTLTVTFDPTCININTGNTGLHAGDLIMFQNASGMALEVVSSVAGQTVTFVGGDSYNLNNSGMPYGTMAQMESPLGSGAFPPTTATRIWMITYYLDTQTNKIHPELMRQVNFNTPTAVGEVIEDMSISYDLTEPSLTPPVKSNQPTPIWPDTVAQIRKVNLTMFARGETYSAFSKQYFRNNLTTEVNIRNLSFFDQFD